MVNIGYSEECAWSMNSWTVCDITHGCSSYACLLRYQFIIGFHREVPFLDTFAELPKWPWASTCLSVHSCPMGQIFVHFVLGNFLINFLTKFRFG